MKLINEQNWKQEITRLKAARMLKCRMMDEIDLEYKETDGFGNNLDLYYIKCGDIICLSEDVEKLDKAIETIENVFVHKQCYISL